MYSKIPGLITRRIGPMNPVDQTPLASRAMFGMVDIVPVDRGAKVFSGSVLPPAWPRSMKCHLVAAVMVCPPKGLKVDLVINLLP